MNPTRSRKYIKQGAEELIKELLKRFKSSRIFENALNKKERTDTNKEIAAKTKPTRKVTLKTLKAINEFKKDVNEPIQGTILRKNDKITEPKLKITCITADIF